MNNRTILVDIDDTIENLLEHWCRMLNERYGTNTDWQSIKEWDMRKAFPTLTKEQTYSVLTTPALWCSLEEKPGAGKYLKQLMGEGFKVYLCTASDYRTIQLKWDIQSQGCSRLLNGRKLL